MSKKTYRTLVRVQFDLDVEHDTSWKRNADDLKLVAEDLISYKWPGGWDFDGISDWTTTVTDVKIMSSNFCTAHRSHGKACGRTVFKANLCKKCHDAQRIDLMTQFKKIKQSLKDIDVEI